MALNWREEEDPKLVLRDLDYVAKVSERFKPVIRHDQDRFALRSFEPTYDSMFATSYHWTGDDIGEVDFMEFFCEWMVVKCGYYGLFKPSIAEVISQIPEKYITDPRFEMLNAYYINTDTIQIYRSGSYQLALVYYGITLSKTG